MDTETAIADILKENEVLKKLKCEVCKVFPKLGSKIYSCPPCQIYQCDKHFLLIGNTVVVYKAVYGNCRQSGHSLRLDSMMTEAFSCFGKFISNLSKRPEPEKSFNCSYSENGCQEEFLARKKAHENVCNYQIVGCPKMDCEELVIFKDMDVHLDQAHKILKVNNKWDFKGTKDELVKVTWCLTSCDQQFFPQMYIKNDYLYFKIVMLGCPENLMYFKAHLTFFQDNGQQFSRDVFVYPITEKGQEYQFSNESLKKLTEYYDPKSMELKQQEKIHFTLKIIDVKYENNLVDDHDGEDPDDEDYTPRKSPIKPQPASKRTLVGGVMVEDLKVGNGPVAKKGKMIGMYYIGKLKANNKMFDATTSGKPFKFRLGKGEVIKGWDIGVDGMKVGGKRRIIGK